MTIRIGQGFDVHAFSDDPERPLVLGGVPAGMSVASPPKGAAFCWTGPLVGTVMPTR